jgi:hypothetical protein
MAVAVQVEVEAVAPLRQRRRARVGDRLMEGVVRRDGLRVALRALDDVAVDVDLAAAEVEEHDVRPQPETRRQLLAELARQFQRARVLHERAVRAVGDRRRQQVAAVAARDDDRRVADDVLDEAVGAPARRADGQGLRRRGCCDRPGGHGDGDGDGATAPTAGRRRPRRRTRRRRRRHGQARSSAAAQEGWSHGAADRTAGKGARGAGRAAAPDPGYGQRPTMRAGRSPGGRRPDGRRGQPGRSARGAARAISTGR